MPVIGTAGHVDHGKSTLVRALTGRDPDRWEEEKRRGLTIDLGFAWMTLPNGSEVSFVDVPGHERFIKNMLAGIETIDAALLVVAADEGWQAQSEEHLAVLDLLEVRRGVAAVTKLDRVDEDTRVLVGLELEDQLAGTTLAGIPVVGVSATTGQGLESLVYALEAATAPVVPAAGRPRMWIDRSFSIAGAGTVVTGTLLGGELEVGMRVNVWPGPVAGRIRSIESHERPHERVAPHRRVAVGLSGLERSAVRRGAMLGLAGQWEPTRRFTALIRPARNLDELPPRGAYHLHIGSGAWPVRIRFLEAGIALCEIPQPLGLEMGDRFILRDTGRRTVIGGGRVLDPAPVGRSPRLRTAAGRLREVVDAAPPEQAAALLSVRQRERAAVLAAHSGGGTPPEAVAAGEMLLDPEAAASLVRSLGEAVDAIHRESPLRPGLTVSEAATRLVVPAETVEALVDLDPLLVRNRGTIARRGHQPEAAGAGSWQEARDKLAAGLAVPKPEELGLEPDLFHALLRAGELVRISPDIVYLPEQVEELKRVLAGMPAGFTVSDFRERAGISRKYAVPFLEWADRLGMTVRQQELRTYRG
jgi:selenocysteine-specific elongation factor